jgi:Spy/CpxP family protein refolding chaperone
MKSFLRPLLAALAVGLALVPVIVRGADTNINNAVDRLDKLVGLTADQKVQAAQIFAQQEDALQAFTSPEDRMIKGMDVRQNARAQIRAILMPTQQQIYEIAPQRLGGGAMQDISVAVDRLDKLVGLTAAQKAQVAEIFAQQEHALQAIIPVEDRAIKGMPIRQNARAQIHAILTPAQQKIYDTSPQRLGGGAMQDAAAIASRVDKVVTLTDDQVAPVAAIYQKMADALAGLSPGDRASGQGAAIWKAAKAEVRALLTPEQQQKFDANPNGAEDMEARAFVRSFLKTAPAIVARVGTVTRVMPADSSVTTTFGINEQVQAMKGTYVYKVQGSAGTGTFKVSWEKPAPSEPINIIKIEGSAGETIQP